MCGSCLHWRCPFTKLEIMGDAIDDALEDENTEEEEERIVGQVLDEIGISMGDEIPDAAGLGSLQTANVAPPAKVPTAATAVGGGDDPALSDLEARLNNLKR
jgi:charged multivesicular body protein 2A